MTLHPVAEKLRTIEAELNAWYFEREEFTKAAILAILGKSHFIAVGPPGTAKTEEVTDIFGRIVDASFFTTQMTSDKPSEAVVGPYDMDGLKRSEFFRNGKGFAQTVNFINFEEIGRASRVLLDHTLSLLQERVIYEVRDGERHVHVAPLYSMFASSNTEFAFESPDKEAAWDRIMVKVWVDQLKSSANKRRLLDRADEPSSRTTVTFKELADVIDHVVPNIPLTDAVRTAVIELEAQIQDAGYAISNRRLRQSVKILRASAFLNGRSQVDVDDIEALQFTLPDTLAQVEPITTMCMAKASPIGSEILTILSDVRRVSATVVACEGRATVEKADVGTQEQEKLTMIRRKIDDLMNIALDRGADSPDIARVQRVIEEWNGAQVNIYVTCLGMPEEIARARQAA